MELSEPGVEPVAWFRITTRFLPFEAPGRGACGVDIRHGDESREERRFARRVPRWIRHAVGDHAIGRMGAQFRPRPFRNLANNPRHHDGKKMGLDVVQQRILNVTDEQFVEFAARRHYMVEHSQRFAPTSTRGEVERASIPAAVIGQSVHDDTVGRDIGELASELMVDEAVLIPRAEIGQRTTYGDTCSPAAAGVGEPPVEGCGMHNVHAARGRVNGCALGGDGIQQSNGLRRRVYDRRDSTGRGSPVTAATPARNSQKHEPQ